MKRLRGEVLEFAPLEAEKRAEHREIRWISLDGYPSSEKMTNSKKFLTDICSIVRGETPVSMSDLSFRDPVSFKSGELRICIYLWKDILEGYDQAENVLEWLGKGVNIREFIRPFRGSFMGVNYDSTDPPSRAFKNHHSCKQFSQFVTETLLQRIETGAIRVWSRVGDVSPPHLVLPMTIEPQKPRLCIDARFLNLWMRDTPFSLDTLVGVPHFVYPNSYMSKMDDKSGYDHILLSPKFYIREMAASIAWASNGSEVKISPVLREEILFWRFLDSWDKVVRWRSESHVAISFTSDASSFRWAAVIRLPSGTLSVGDYGRAHKREGNVGRPQGSTVPP